MPIPTEYTGTPNAAASAEGGPWPLPNDPAVPSRDHRRQRTAGRLRLQAYLYLGTCLTTFAAGTIGWQPAILGLDDTFWADVGTHWSRGLTYMLAVMAILTAHEAGHFVAAWKHRIPATLPYFLPVPVMLTGTFGAVIGMEGSRADRRQLFDIALAGPVAGLLVAVPILAAGMLTGEPVATSPFACRCWAPGCSTCCVPIWEVA